MSETLLNIQEPRQALELGERIKTYSKDFDSLMASLTYIKQNLLGEWAANDSKKSEECINNVVSMYKNNIIPCMYDLGDAVVKLSDAAILLENQKVGGSQRVTDLGVDLSNKTLDMNNYVNRSRVDSPNNAQTNVEAAERFNNPIFGGNIEIPDSNSGKANDRPAFEGTSVSESMNAFKESSSQAREEYYSGPRFNADERPAFEGTSVSESMNTFKENGGYNQDVGHDINNTSSSLFDRAASVTDSSVR